MNRKVVFIDYKELVPNDIIRADIESRTFEYHIDILKSSIEAQGILTPLLVSPSGGKFLIVDGNRRFVAGSKAGLKEFPCIVVDEYNSDNLAKITEAGFSANELRQDLTPSQEIEALKRVCEKGELTLEQISEATGKTIKQLGKISARKGLHVEVVKMMDEGKISRAASDNLACLNHDEQKEVISTLKSLEIPLSEPNLRLYSGKKISESMGVSAKVVKKLKENIGLHADELDKLKKHYQRRQKELTSAHQLTQRLWRVPELHDYIRENHPGVYKDFNRVLKVLGF